MMIRAAILVPLRDNDGKAFGFRTWAEFRTRLLALSGGYTDAGQVQGVWVDSGRTYDDRSRRYEVAIQSWRDVHAVIELADWVRDAFRQEAIYIEIAGLAEIIGPPV
jgi:hypothetical protein